MSTLHDHEETVDSEPTARGYGLSGQIMLTAIIVLFVVVVLMVGIHLYARFYLIRLRRRQLERRRNRRSIHIVHYTNNHTERGLEQSVLNTLPVFKRSSSEEPNRVSECAVCLSEFEENEVLRKLPKCNHSFHIECIDMWFQSHSTCPLCRSPVEPVVELNESVELCEECKEEDCGTSSSSGGGVGKGLEVRVDVGMRRELEIPLTPNSRMLSFKRILSMGLRSPVGSRVTTPSAAGTSGGEDLESGRRESTTPIAR